MAAASLGGVSCRVPCYRADPQGAVLIVAVLVVSVFIIAWLIFLFSYGYLWIKALLGRAYVPILELIGMRLRGVDPRAIVDGRVAALAAGLPIGTRELEAHCLAGGRSRLCARLWLPRRQGYP